jgi:type IV secretion system protein VirB9
MSRLAVPFACVMLALAAPVVLAPAAAQTAVTPAPGPGDPRIREIMYNPDQVIAVTGLLGYELTVEFDPAERIENVSIGDSLGWQVTPNRKATLLFLKPMSKTAATSMTVVTTRRIYSFLLTTVEPKGPDDARAMFRLRFQYPPEPEPVAVVEPEPPPPPPSPETLNFTYSWSGSKLLIPMRVFDDGASTFFEFAQTRDVPAVYVVGVDRKEELANTRIAGKYLVVDRIAPSFVLRYGKTRTEVHNETWAETEGAEVSNLPKRRGG